ncbi:hypothetical protein [Aeoliella sp. SH292]|uniref:hypothetical protein n=1 Tax=Aeoliella sp. SH292 TaxID=3454464 RepID=UPI003F970909
MADYPPPDHLSDRSKTLWSEMVPHRGTSAGRLAVVQTALECLDRADEAAALITKEGLTTKTGRSGVTHVHPATKIEKESRAMFFKLWQSMGFGFD